jgi:hypothetical protein
LDLSDAKIVSKRDAVVIAKTLDQDAVAITLESDIGKVVRWEVISVEC